MAKLGTKQRPAIVHVRTQARAEEIVSVFAEHGWQFILGIEPDKPENIADLTRLLNSPQPTKAKRVNGQLAPEKSRKSYSKRKNYPPLKVIHTVEKKTKLSSDDMKISEETYEYVTSTNEAKLHAIISCALSIFFLVKLFTTTSLWYVVLLVLPLLYFVGILYALVLNQKVTLHGNKITILRRRQTPITANIADSLYQIIVKKGVLFKFKFRFCFDNGRKMIQITPAAHKNGNRLLQQLTSIIKQENIVVDIIEK